MGEKKLRPKIVIGNIGTILKFFSLVFLIPIIPAFIFNEPLFNLYYIKIPFTALVFMGCSFFTFTIGFILEKIGIKKDFTDKEGFAIVSMGWLVIVLFASLPFIFTNSVASIIDGYFEAMSGVTTTGATVLSFPLENHFQSILFWRALLQYIGGMGIIVLSVALLTRLTSGGKRLIESEVAGSSIHNLKPTIMQTARLLWLVYGFFTVAQILILRFIGIPLYECIYHAFTTMSTGGFSMHTNSIAHYDPIVHWVIFFFMIIGGTNFTLHYYALHGKSERYRKDSEFRFYILIIGFVVLLITINLIGTGIVKLEGLRLAAFQSTSIITGTGYSVVNYDAWSSFAKFLLFIFMFIGGCAGSTSGGMKQVRILLMFKMLKKKIMQFLHPNAVIHVRLGNKVIADKTLQTITMFFFAYILIFIISTTVMLALGMDMITGASASASSLGNVGPALGNLGPEFNYAAVPEVGKIWLSFIMWIGRLEIFTALILFVPTAYKRETLLE